MFKSRPWIRKIQPIGGVRKCRICDKKLQRGENYLNFDHATRNGLRIHDSNGNHVAQINTFFTVTICQDCVQDWATKIKELNNDLQRNSISGC